MANMNEEAKKQYKNKKFFFKIIRGTIKIFYRKRKFIGVENIPSSPCFFVGNHAQLHGPLASEIFFPRKKAIWCIGQMMKIKEVPGYAYQDFWSYKPKYIRWFFKIVSYIIAPISAYVFTNADTIGVYKDARIITTFKETVKRLEQGCDIIIFPENEEEFNNIVNEFQDKFVDAARLYARKNNKSISFVPMYNAAKIKTIVFGKPIEFDVNMNMDEQRVKIVNYLKEEITRIALELPPHKVVPYLNVGSKNYKYSKEKSK